MPRSHKGSPSSREAGYPLETVGRACRLLKAFGDNEEMLTLAEVAARTGFEKTIAFRLVHTLEREGFLRKIDGRRYCCNITVLAKKRFRIGYAQQTTTSSFSNAVTESLRWAAEKNLIDLIVLDNAYSTKTALRNAERFIAAKVDLAVEFQTYEKIAPMISSLFRAVGIPLIAIEIPHPGAIFFGVDNYRAGMAAGSALAKAAKQFWQGDIEELLLLELEIAGQVPHLRLAGVEAALREAAPTIGRIRRMNTRGEFLHSFDSVRKHLRSSPPRRTLVAGVNDLAVIGALKAFEEAGRRESCLGVGLGAMPEGRSELRCKGTRLIGSIAFFPERYGDTLVRLALDVLHNRHVPPAVFAPHQLITSQNVDQFYPEWCAGTHREIS